MSRAAVKWLEAREHLQRAGLDPNQPRRWLELGAAPGGITEGLLATHPASTVTTIDLAPLHPRLLPHPRLHPIRCDVATFSPPPSDRFDGLVCDVNGPPAVALDATCRLIAGHLTPGAPVVFTLKLPRWASLHDDLAAARAALRALGVPTEARHLVANRQELTLIGALAPR